jgi:hypothetical protein
MAVKINIMTCLLIFSNVLLREESPEIAGQGAVFHIMLIIFHMIS